jgi:hypothetical protein
MAIYMIGYDLNRPGQDYKELINAIEALSGTRWHCLDSTWLVLSNLRAIDIANRLTPHIDKGDELLVSEITKGNSAWAGFNDECSKWLKNNL